MHNTSKHYERRLQKMTKNMTFDNTTMTYINIKLRAHSDK